MVGRPIKSASQEQVNLYIHIEVAVAHSQKGQRDENSAPNRFIFSYYYYLRDLTFSKKSYV